MFRHSWAQYFLGEGGQEHDLKCLSGWDSDDIVRWYGSSMADKRAHKAHKEYSPANRLLGERGKKGR